ncbi:MAG: glutamine--tRNA ligase/YqeY domain fusion protein [Neisseriaceae bacterium]|nr:MAG: glutamine--tRNA ligase/YqeY domain fusion protein [Neisseriaceae bacterium]
MHKESFADNHFIRTIIEEDLVSNKHQKIITRFPPEPNGYLHIGHAKSLCLNFGMAFIYEGICHLRFDDTNPEKESEVYVYSIQEDICWLGFHWDGEPRYASNYFEKLYEYAEILIQKGLAYVDDLSIEEIRDYRGTLKESGRESPYRSRDLKENLDLFRRMRQGEFEDGTRTLRLKIDMSSSNINMRDPIIYRIRRARHHRTGDKWCIYPMYDYTHCLSDALEEITHSLCTLEFEDHRPLYDWILEKLDIEPKPRQYEFSRLELLYTVTSKRKLNRLVIENYVSDWDDPRMPTIAGMRRRGYTPEGIQLFCKRIGISKSENMVDLSILEGAIRDDLEKTAPRMMAVLNPIKIDLINYDEFLTQSRDVPYHPQMPEMGQREVKISRIIYIERDDFTLEPPPKWQRLTLGGEVRLRYSYVIKCEEVIQDDMGHVVELRCRVDYNTLGKKPEGRKVKGVIHWISEDLSSPIEVRLYDRLFTVARPDMVKDENGNEIDFCEFINPDSVRTIQARAEKIVNELPKESRWQFERLGYFVTDRYDHTEEKPVFNRTVTLKDTWSK